MLGLESVSIMSNTVLYEGYSIRSFPKYLEEWEKWQFRIVISFKQHGAMQSREFSSDILYITEHDADIHGITFGQHLIDGKVEGRSVKDMKTTDRRATPRLRVQFRTTFSASSKLEGTGIMLDLSTGGCRIESPITVEPGVSLELRIYAPDIQWPLMIAVAIVQWVSGQTFGLAFFRITDTEQQRLGEVIRHLMKVKE